MRPGLVLLVLPVPAAVAVVPLPQPLTGPAAALRAGRGADARRGPLDARVRSAVPRAGPAQSQAGRAGRPGPQPCRASTRSATLICWDLEARDAREAYLPPPKERQVEWANCSPPEKPFPVSARQLPPLSHPARRSQVAPPRASAGPSATTFNAPAASRTTAAVAPRAPRPGLHRVRSFPIPEDIPSMCSRPSPRGFPAAMGMHDVRRRTPFPGFSAELLPRLHRSVRCVFRAVMNSTSPRQPRARSALSERAVAPAPGGLPPHRRSGGRRRRMAPPRAG